MNRVYFVTTNEGKLAEARRVLGENGIEVVHLRQELREPKERDVVAVAIQKAEQARKLVRGPVIVEDTGIFLAGLGGLPGSRSKDFMKEHGVGGVLQQLEGKPREAHFKTVVAFAAPGRRIKVFEGITLGRISSEPRGTTSESLPYDRLFIPESGDGRTYAEMPVEEKLGDSSRAKAFEAFAKGIIAEGGRS